MADNYTRKDYKNYVQIRAEENNESLILIQNNLLKQAQVLFGEHDIIVVTSLGTLNVTQNSPSPTMHVIVSPGIAYSKMGNYIQQTSNTLLLIDPSDLLLDRIDIVQASIDWNDVTPIIRPRISPTTKQIEPYELYTEKQANMQLTIKKGTAGSGVAPTVDIGWVKLAEVFVASGVVQIVNGAIYNVTANFKGQLNAGWTTDLFATYKALPYLEHRSSLMGDHISITGIRHEHIQGSASSIWTINHMLNATPWTISVLSGTTPPCTMYLPQTITINTLDQVVLTFADSLTGVARLVF